MPKELLCTGIGKVEWREYVESPLKPGEVRIQSQLTAAKHGTEAVVFKGQATNRGRFDGDLRLWVPAFEEKGEKPDFSFPEPAGNMTVGIIIEVGPEVSSVRLGNRVLVYGGFRETHICRWEDCRLVPDRMEATTAVCLDPAVYALGAIRDGNIRIGDTVAIFGMGAIGLFAVQLAKLAGASLIIAVEPEAARRDLAISVGADVFIDPALTDDVGKTIKRMTENKGVDVAIEYSGNQAALQDATRSVAVGGIVVIGAFSSPYGAGLDFGAETHINTLNIIFSQATTDANRDHPRWNKRRIYDYCWRLLRTRQITGDFVSPTVSFKEQDQILELYSKLVCSSTSVVKFCVTYGKQDKRGK